MSLSQNRIDALVARLEAVCIDHLDYVSEWKARTGGKAIGVLPMNFPLELIQAAGALPVVIQESDEPITDGRNLIYEYYCAYSKSITDQAAKQKYDVFDGIVAVDHCVALLGAFDAMRYAVPDLPIYLAQFPASMDEPASSRLVDQRLEELRGEIETICGTAIDDQAMRSAIKLRNADRQAIRRLMAMRSRAEAWIPARVMQTIVQSSMIMETAEHIEVLEELEALYASAEVSSQKRVKLHLSGHFCHAPRPELLDMFEECGATIIDDDLYTGYRFVSTDIAEQGDGLAALRDWYFNRNVNAPCSTRAQKSVDWETFLVEKLATSGAEGVIILMAKFCEPHMLYYPELRKAFRAASIPYLLIETEHEGLAIEMLRSRVEALIETIRQRRPVPA